MASRKRKHEEEDDVEVRPPRVLKEPKAAAPKKSKASDLHFTSHDLGADSADAMGGDLAALDEVWLPVCLEPDMSDVIEEEGSDPTFCFKCRYGQSKNEAEEQGAMQDIDKYVVENYHHADEKEIWTTVQQMYNDTVRKFVDGEPAWHCEMIRKHYHLHAPLPIITLETMLKDETRVFHVARNNMILSNGTDKYQIDDKNFDKFQKVRKMIKEDMKAVQELRNQEVL
jgi:hypothetical protein